MTDTLIQFFSEHPEFVFIETDPLGDWFLRCASAHGKKIGGLNVILVSDSDLLDLNQRYLEHDTFTDIITFDYSEGQRIEGELYISYDRILDNASLHDTDPEEELNRVMIHGVLHLIGYGDKSPEEKAVMRSREDEWLSLRLL